MSAPAAVRSCTCGHGENVHTAHRPEGACTACTQCDGLLRDRPHDWHRCCCLEFEPAPRTPIEAEIAGELEVLEPAPSPWAGHPIGLHSHVYGEPCDDTCTFYPAPSRGANSEADSTD